MRIGKLYTLTPNERKRYTIEYSDWLDTGETIDAVEFTIEEEITTPPFEITDDDIDVGGTLIAFFAEGGIDGSSYKVIVKVTTSNGQVKEDHILYAVKDC